MSNGVLAICVSKLAAQPYLSLANILFGLSYGGVQSLLGIADTGETVSNALPPPRSMLLSSFILPYNPNLRSALTCGARPWRSMLKGEAIDIGVFLVEVIRQKIGLQWMS